ncbi:MAG TPA: chromosome segregation protein SMC [Polyangiales bacterium]|nr:chromosome segregation protein SMC [Polyangiales bacterium]
MKIKKLEVCGFKSFVDPVALHFDHDVTCIVGPNGCGKSNVVDAIRWVMGEQSAKNLRGRAMEDVIFNGTESRGPHGFAEVTITFDNADRMAPEEYKDYGEIAVTRRLDRSGNSEYMINKTAVRLLDVTNLFLGTGVGRRAYSIIEQGRIGVIVTAKPQDRRHLIEEAAGITKFKAKKQAAERRMEQTQQNLLRVNDIVEEIQKTLASLKRQAQKAERYKRYREEIRDLELWVASHRYLELTVSHGVLRTQLDRAVATAEGARAALRVREAELESERATLQSLESQVEKAQTRAYTADNAVRLLESQISHQTEQLAQMADRARAAAAEVERLAAQKEELQNESATLRNQLESLVEAEAIESERFASEGALLDQKREASTQSERALAELRARAAEVERRIARADAMLAGFEQRRADTRVRLARLESERAEQMARVIEQRQEADELRARLDGLHSGQDELGKAKEELEAELVQLRQDIVQSDETVERLRAELAQKRSRLHSLIEIQQRFEGVGAGVRALMTQYGRAQTDGPGKVHGLLADRFECAPELTKALAAALGERLQYVVVDDLTTGVDAVRYLSEGKRGRATLIPSVPRSDARPNLPTTPWPEGPGILGPLLGLVRTALTDQHLAEHMLGDVLVVESLEIARELHEQGRAPGMLVTRDGQVIYTDGRLSGGDGEDAGAHLIEVKREMRELRDEVARLDVEMASATSRHSSLRSAIAQRQAALEATRSDAHDKEIALVKADKDLRRAEEAVSMAQLRIEKLSVEVEELAEMLGGESDEERDGRTERGAAFAQKAELEAEIVAADGVYREQRAAVEAQSAVVTELRVRAAQAKQKLESDRAVIERLARSLEELDARSERLQRELSELADKQRDIEQRGEHDKTELAERAAEAAGAQSELTIHRTGYETARAAVSEQEHALRDVRAAIDADVQQAGDLTVKEREIGMAIEHLLDNVYQKHRLDVRVELTDYHDREIPDENLRSRITELTSVVERMGEINLTAIEEYEERSKRHDYLVAQKEDLEKALSQLDQAIRQMNRESRKLFRDTFDEVNARFQQMFPRIFGGGRAELRLTDTENLLETGIDIIAMPPGKKLTSIELMSGGEKALTAVALIFAIFQFKPSPFCLLDEVDAPLDEANIGRYCEVIRAMTGRSQFIVISHSKATMESADVLYGVTMETPGVSKIVSVELRDTSESRRAPKLENAQVA